MAALFTGKITALVKVEWRSGNNFGVSLLRRGMDRRCFSNDNAKDYEIALNPSRFDIIKSRLEASQYEEKYYSEDVPKVAAPEPPKCPSPSAPADGDDDNNNHIDFENSLDAQLESQRQSDEDLNLEAVYSKCEKIKNWFEHTRARVTYQFSSYGIRIPLSANVIT